jgi:hypothetical protein
MNTQFTVSEIIKLIQNSRWDMEYFMPLQNEVADRINAKLRGENPKFLSDHEHYIYRRCEDKVIGDTRELEQTVKYAGIEPHIADKIELGAILVSSWGYDQTNVDFYVVVGMTAKMVQMLPLKRISRSEEGCSSMAGTTTAAQEADFRSEILKKKIQPNNWIRLTSFSSAHLWDGKKQYESWYA